MAVRIELKRSNVPGKIPSTSQLQLGEVALNTYDGAAYFKKNVNGTETIVQFATTTGTGSGTVTSASHADYADTSGYATNAGSAATATSASYAFQASNAVSSSYAVTASFAINAPNAVSASYAQTASYSDNFNIGNNLTVVGTITAQKLVVQVITSSTEFVTGSTIFGSQLTDTHQFTGSVSITGSLSVNGVDFIQTSASFDNRINGISGSFITSASFNSFTASTNDSLADIKNATASLYNATASIYNATASIYNATASLYAFTASILNHSSSVSASVDALNTFSASILNYTASNNANIAALNAATASLYNATASLYNATASIYATTQSLSASIGSLSSSFLSVSASNSTRILALENFSSSLDATFATDADLNALSSSFIAFTASINSYTSSNNNNIAALYAATASLNNATASLYNATASIYGSTASLHNFSASILNYTASQNILNGTFATTGSNIFKGNQTISGSLTVSGSTNINGTTNITGSVNVSGSTGNVFTANVDTIVFTGSFLQSGSANINGSLTVTDTITAQKLVVQTVSSSVIYSSGSNVFGNDLSNTQIFTGSVSITGSLSVNGRNYLTDSSSFSTRVFNLEQTSASLLAATASLYNATASIYNATSSLYNFSASILNYTASNNANITQLYNATSSLYNFSASILSYTSSNNATITQLYNETASLRLATGSLYAATASLYNATASIYGATASLNNFSASILNYTSSTNATITQLQNATASLYNATSSLYNFSASINAFTASQVILNGTYATTGSNIFRGNQTVTGSLFTSGSNTLVGITNLTGALNVSGSETIKGYIQFEPVTTNVNNNISASYIYVSGSTNDLYFTQNSAGYNNTTRLRWLEGNLYTGLLSGGVLSTTIGSTTFNLSSGSAIIVNLNASTGSADPYPTVQYLKWGNYTNVPIINSASAQISYVGIDGNGAIVQQVVPWGSTDITQWDTQVEIGVVLHLTGSVSTGVYNSPQLGYGFSQRTDDFVRAFGPLKIAGHTLQPSGSTLGLIKTGGQSYNNGSNYTINPNHPSTVTDPAINTSKIYRYYVSGSTPIINTGVGGAGYTFIDPGQYNNNGTLSSVAGGQYTIQRVFWIPNSPTNAFLVYYGNAVYNSAANAQAAIDTEQFTEAPNTAQNAILVAYIIVAGNETNLQNATFIPGGLFRSIAGVGNSNTAPVSNTLAGLSDVSVGSRVTGDLLYYNGSQWVNSKSLTGNYSITGSFSTNDGITAVTINAPSITGSLLGTAATASFVQTAQTASYWSGSITNALSSSFASTASYWSGSIINAATASYVVLAQSASYWSGSIINAASASFASTASYWSGSIVNALSASFANNANNAINAQTASYVVLAQSASYWSGSIQNAVSAAFADFANSASFATTASFALNAGSGGGGGLSALYIQDEGITQGTASYIDFTGAGVSATVTNGTASINIPGGGGGGTGGSAQTFTQSLAANTWSFAHSVNSRTPIVEVYDSNYNVIIPTSIYNPGPFQTNIYFDVSQSGYAIISTGGVLAVSGSNAVLNQNVAATTWSFNHDLHTTYPVFTIYDSNDDVIIPQRIHAVDTASAEIYFSTPRTGKAIASVGGNISFASQSLTTVSASFAATASYIATASFALTASYAENAGAGAGFPYSGSAVITGSLLVSGSGITGSLLGTASYALAFPDQGYPFTQSAAAVTWSINHSLNTNIPLVNVYDSNYIQIVPAEIVAINANNVEVRLAYSSSGYAIVSKGSGVTAQNAVTASHAITASYAVTATSASFASTASYLNPVTSGYVVLTQVSQSLNFVDDAAAAAGGVPLGGLYRNGNFIMIRLT